MVFDMRKEFVWGPKNNKKKGLRIKCRNKSISGTSTLNTTWFDHDVFDTDPGTWFEVAGNRGPCWHQRLMIHERLHWVGKGLFDWVFTFEPAVDNSDRGPCPAVRVDDMRTEVCYHGFCATGIAKWSNDYYAQHNVDNYAYLIRNMALFWARRMASIPTPTFDQCDSGDCTVPETWPPGG